MKSVIICEGTTDLTLVQYFMEKVNSWSYKDNVKILSDYGNCKNFESNYDKLSIIETGSCSKIIKCFRDILEINYYNSPTDGIAEIDNIVIISDNDEISTISSFEHDILAVLQEKNISNLVSIRNDSWMEVSMSNFSGKIINFKILLLIIPFNENGALETFLLNSIATADSYEKEIIDKCNSFVELIDKEPRYLKHRRHKTKAKFDVYFSVRTPLEQFSERRNILRSVPWENYESVRSSFIKLKDLSSCV